MLYQLYRWNLAVCNMKLTYRLWERWKDLDNPDSRRLAIKAKTYGLIAYDRTMCTVYDR